MELQIDRYNNCLLKLNKAKATLESKMQRHFDFEIAIVYQASDGICVCYVDESSLAPLDLIIKLIETPSTKITIEQFNELSI
jgi:hypothetical protein